MKISTWPEPDEYKEALLNRATTCSDHEIQQGNLFQTPTGALRRLNKGGSPYVLVYRVDNRVVRLFTSDIDNDTSPPPDIDQRYQAITAWQRRMEARGQALPYLVSHHWIKPGLMIQQKSYPFLKVDFVDGGQKLGDFLWKNHQHQPSLRLLAEKWLQMMRELEQARVAHGDLDLSNVLVQGRYPGLKLFLVDFDGMYVPDLAGAGLAVAERGHLHFQYPPRAFGPTMDRFSSLVIYLSLCALAQQPTLWDTLHATESQTLLGAGDFQRLGQSAAFAKLKRETGNRHLQDCLNALEQSIDSSTMPPPLDTILQISLVPDTPYIRYPQQDADLFQGTMVPLPIDDGVEISSPLPEPEPLPEPTFFAPDYHSTAIHPTVPLQRLTPARSRPPPRHSPDPAPSSSKSCLIASVIILIIVIAIVVVVVLVLHHQQSTSSDVLPVAALLAMDKDAVSSVL